MNYISLIILIIISNASFGSNVIIHNAPILSKNKHLEKSINQYFKIKNKKTSQKEIQNYLISRNYFKYQIIKKNSQYTIKNPIKTIFILKGNKFFRESILKQVIEKNKFLLSINPYDITEEKIKTAYQKKGFQNVSIKRTVITKKWDEWVYLNIREGHQIRIANIIITGSFSKDPSEYIHFIRNNSSPLIQKGFYNKKDLEIGYKNLVSHLRTSGFLQSKIYPDRVIFKGDLATIKVTLEEGPLTIIKNIVFKGVNTFSVGELLSSIKSKVQSPLNLEYLEEDLLEIKRIFQNKGFLYFKILNEKNLIKYEQDNQYASLVISVDEGNQIIVSKVSISGLQKTKLSLISKLLKFKVGDILTPEKIEKSKKALGRTDLFSQIFITHQTNKNSTRVKVKLTERKRRSLRGGIGLTSERGGTGRSYSELTYRNLFGWGRSLFLKASGQISLLSSDSFLEYEISGGYKEIFSPGQGYQGNISLSNSKNIFNYSQNINIIYKTQVSFFIDKKVNQNLNLNWNLFNFENRREDCIYNTCPQNLQQIGSTSFTIQNDSRDNIFNPKRGSLFSLSGEWASPYLASSQDIRFWKLYFQQQLYYSPLNDYTLAFALKGGVIKAKDTLPVSRAFILGGQTSIRGYDGNIEGERLPSSKIAPIETANESLKIRTLDNTIEKALTNAYGLVKLELRFPISKTFKGLIFYDAGVVFLENKNNQLKEFGHSTGIGFRYETFLLPIGLDIGYKLPPKSGVDYRFHFSIGLF